MHITRQSIIVLAIATAFGSAVAFAQTTSPTSTHSAGMQAHMAVMLKAADTNNDGLISKAEAEQNLPRLAKHFDDIDTNKDGMLSSDELKAMHDKMLAHRPHHPHFHDGLMAADTNHDGVISRAEAEAMTQKIMQNFDAADTNKDGQLSRDEIKAMYQKMHANAHDRRHSDTDKNSAPSSGNQ
ncbi:MAG TPA: EF-hand domain-containing protein [Rhodocyclaceae bacterium]|nr:EF-hand domain-containing protein [Rhodocyclaceae bacterium]